MTDNRLSKVRAEIKWLRKEVKDNIAELGNSESERIGLFKDLEIYDNILSFIDSMEDSPCIKCEGDGLPGTCASISELGRCPLKNQKQEPVSEDLEKAIGDYCSNPDNFATWIGGEETDDIPLIVKAIKFGAKWKEQQMIKDSVLCGVDGWFINNKRNCRKNGRFHKYYVSTITHDKPLPMENGKDYRLITIKED